MEEVLELLFGKHGVDDVSTSGESHSLSNIEFEDLFLALKTSKKKRHEIKDNNIRAVYGHSIEAKIDYIKSHPPNILYHGTTKENAEAILLEGLKPMQRQYVHLSTSLEAAIIVGKRKTDMPVVLIIDAHKAYDVGIEFYHANENIWLSEFISPIFICK